MYPGIGSLVGSPYVSTLNPVVICPYLCTMMIMMIMTNMFMGIIIIIIKFVLTCSLLSDSWTGGKCWREALQHQRISASRVLPACLYSALRTRPISLVTKITPTKIACLKLSRKFPVGLGT